EGAGPTERVAPDGIVELVFHYGEPVAMRHAGERFRRQPRSCVVSQTRRFVEFRPAGAVGFVAVRFRPWGAHHFLGVPVSAFSDLAIDARDLWRAAAVAELEERLAAAGSLESRVALVEAFLWRRLAEHEKEDIEALVRQVWAGGGELRVAELARRTGVGERRLERTFAAALGTSPKGYSRVVRFLRACRRLRLGEWSTLTEVAYDCGYYDQSHFVAECRDLAGMTPGELAAAPSFSHLEIG
ncbi:MAG: helix-turn-helix transcriptional regulator, partial [Thermoanaerobaculia bacterium]|nr:helix-turn-helix transcriptional regulator [Thermoanaerobaculia bacterium]